MSLSVCLVARDDEDRLPVALRSVQGVADQIVVADTGSRDCTAAVASELGAEVHSIPWDDDFADARNRSIALARSDWILWLNPDEELLGESREALRSLLDAPKVLGYRVRIRERVAANRPDALTETKQLRLFRRHGDLHFVGRLYTKLVPSAEAVAAKHGLQVLHSGILLDRHAYLSVIDPAKLRWIRRLLERELLERPGQIDYLIEYGRTLLSLGEAQGSAVMEEASRSLRELQSEPQAPTPAVGVLLDYLLSDDALASRLGWSAGELEQIVRRWFPLSPPLVWRLARRAFDRGEDETAIGLLQTLLQMGKSGVYDRSYPFAPDILGDSARMNLAICYTRAGKPTEALALLTSLVHVPDHRAQALACLSQIQSLGGARPGGQP